MVAKIKRVIVASMLDVDKNTERPVTIRHAIPVSNDCRTIGSTSQLLIAAMISPTAAPAIQMMTAISKSSQRDVR
jgi:hypothetical protein